LGGILLLTGRKYMWILLGAGGFLIAAALTAEIQGYPNSWSLIEEGQWISLLIAVGIGALGVYVGQHYEHLSVDIIGFAIGVFVATWFDEVLLVLNGQDTNDFTWWVALIFIAAGFVGVWVTRQDPEQALILISVLIGARTISDGLNLDQTKNMTAVITLGLALTGVVVQYASLLRERPRIGQQLPPVPHPISEELPYE
jgi:hypothetical protein